MLFGLLGIWLGALAILLSGYFYTRAMFAALREQALTPSPPLGPSPASRVPANVRSGKTGRELFPKTAGRGGD